MRILLLGANGQLGHELVGPLSCFAQLAACTRHEVELADHDALRKAVVAHDPRVIVNAAAWTDVDGAEDAPELAARVNGEATAVLGELCRSGKRALVHVSTDQVFDGCSRRPYREDDEPAPVNAYGRSKLAGERALAELDAPALVLRTAWVYSLRRRSFVRVMLDIGRRGDPLRVVDDQIGSPTFCRDLAQLVALLVRQLGADPHGRARELSGIYHAAGDGAASRFELAGETLRLAGLDASLEPVSMDDYATHARRPRYTALDCDKLERTFGLRLPPWRAGLARALSDVSP